MLYNCGIVLEDPNDELETITTGPVIVFEAPDDASGADIIAAALSLVPCPTGGQLTADRRGVSYK